MKRVLLFIIMLLGVTGIAKADVEWKIWEGTHAFANWSGNFCIHEALFDCLEAGDILYGTVSEIVTGQSDTPQIQYKFQINHDPWTWESDGHTIINFTEAGNFSLTITTAILDKIKLHYNMQIYGAYCTLTKLSIKKKNSVIKSPDFGIEGFNTGDYATGKGVNKSFFANAVSGDYVVISGSMATADDNKWGFSIGNPATWEINIGTLGGGWFAIDDAFKTALTSNDGWIGGKNMTYSGMAWYHPISSFKIGSIGYATFSSDQQVTAPNTVTAYKATVNGGSVTLTPFTNNIIPANTGAIIAGDEGSVLEFTASSASTSETSDLQPVTSATDITSLASGYDYYVLYNNASDNLALSDLVGTWGNWHPDQVSWDSENHTLTYATTASGEGGWLGKDWSNYSALQLTFSSNTMQNDVTFYVAYSGHDGDTTEGTLGAGETTVTIPLHETSKSAIGNFSCYSSPTTAGAFTFESASLIKNTPTAEFRKTTSGTLAANKAYLKIASGSPARLSIVFDDEETTGINTVKASEFKANDNQYYNLRGQRVAQPTRGLYIVNGRKVVIK